MSSERRNSGECQGDPPFMDEHRIRVAAPRSQVWTALHRFVDSLAESTKPLVSARSYAHFPGLHGRLYRALLVGTGAHVLSVRRMLRTIERTSLG